MFKMSATMRSNINLRLKMCGFVIYKLNETSMVAE